MIRPVIKQLCEIIDKLGLLKTTVENIESIPLQFPTGEQKDGGGIPIEECVRACGGHGAGLSVDRDSEAVCEDITRLMAWSEPAQNAPVIQKELEALSHDRLKGLLEQIVMLLLDDSVPKTQMFPGNPSDPNPGPLCRPTKERMNLEHVRYCVEQQIQKNAEKAKSARWQKHVRPLVGEIEKLLFPFWHYLKEHGSYGAYENVVLMEIIRNCRLESIPEVINELERVKYRLEVQAELDDSAVKHSLGFRSVHWFGTDYSFTGQQAVVAKILWEEWEKGTPDVGDATLLEESESESKRLKDVFKGHPAWGAMIVPGETKGTHRLADPAKKRKKAKKTAKRK